MSDIVGFGDDVPFELRLAEAIAWCKPRAFSEDFRNCLRSKELQPDFFTSNRIYTVQQVTRQRCPLEPLTAVTKPEQLQGGKLLLYFPDEQVWDGASDMASQGFFDQYDAPPWDTWIGLFYDTHRSYLVSWVPPELIEAAEAGISVNCVDCIGWLSNVNVELSRKLRDRGLID